MYAISLHFEFIVLIFKLRERFSFLAYFLSIVENSMSHYPNAVKGYNLVDTSGETVFMHPASIRLSKGTRARDFAPKMSATEDMHETFLIQPIQSSFFSLLSVDG